MRVAIPTLILLAALAVAGCGGDEDDVAPADPEAEARVVVDDYFRALIAGDAAGACSLTSEAGQQKVTEDLNRVATEVPSADLAGDYTNCEEALGALTARIEEAQEDTTALEGVASAIDAGGSEGVEVDVSLGETSGLVTVTPGKSVQPIAVEEEEATWRLSDPTVILFGVGKNAG